MKQVQAEKGFDQMDFARMLFIILLVLEESQARITVSKTNRWCAIDENGESYFFGRDGYRKCSTSCDKVTKLFSGKFPCGDCCITKEESLIVPSKWETAGPILLVVLVVASVGFVGNYLWKHVSSKRQGQTEEESHQFLQQHETEERNEAEERYESQARIGSLDKLPLDFKIVIVSPSGTTELPDYCLSGRETSV